MSLDAALLIARSGLLHTQRALSNAADNVANAETEGYTRKRVVSESVTASGQGMGVRSLGPSRDVDNALINEMHKRRSESAAAELRDSVLGRINQAHGDPEKGEGLGDLIGKLRTSFIELRLDPAQVVKQQAVVLNAAQNLNRRFNDLSRVVGEERQSAHDGIVREVSLINERLREIATLTLSIKELSATGSVAADVEDKRDMALAQLSESLEFRAVRQGNGGLVLLFGNVISATLSETGDAFSVADAFIAPESFYGSGGTIPPITMNGVDVTTQLRGGKLGELLTLRDQTLPRYQAELDIGATELADRFRAEGIKFFTDNLGSVPDPDLPYKGSAQIGFANRIQINPTVSANVRLLRDGTETITGPPSFTPNPVGGPASFTTLIDRLLTHTFGETKSGGASWGGFATSGLGPDGSLSSPFGTPRTIEDYTSLVTASQTTDSAAASRSLDAAKQFSLGLEAKFTRESRVDVDSEMASLITLQNAYAANARVLSTAQSMWDALFGSVR